MTSPNRKLLAMRLELISKKLINCSEQALYSANDLRNDIERQIEISEEQINDISKRIESLYRELEYLTAYTYEN